MTIQLIIFDFDGVVADSETIACGVLARMLTMLGHPMSTAESIERFMGKRASDVKATVESLVGRPLPNFAEDLQSLTFEAFKDELQEVSGLGQFLASHAAIPRCIASSSSQSRIRFCIDVLRLTDYFGDHVFSAEEVTRGKPFPDIFLHAAKSMGVEPRDVIVIEDSPGGVEAAVAAGMEVIGLLAASHLRPGHEGLLRAKNATYIASTYDEVSRLIDRLQSDSSADR